MFNDIPDQKDWVSGFVGLIFKQRRQLHVRIDQATTVNIYPAGAIWLVVKIIPLSALKTALEYELYAWASQESPSLGASVKELKESTVAEAERLQILQKQAIEGSLCLDEGSYDVLRDSCGNVLITAVQMDQQNAIHALLIAHRKLERSNGMEIQPATRHMSLSEKGQEDDNRK
jgi:hypothetical protein